MLEIIRVWTDEKGWIHEARHNNLPLASSKHRDSLQDQYPNAVLSGRVICGDNEYQESRDN